MRQRLRIEGKTALHDFVEKLCSVPISLDGGKGGEGEEESTTPSMVFVFDFDRTLTNGFSDASPNVEISKRVRGGNDTIKALRMLKRRGCELFVVTARGPSRASVDQLTASFNGAQKELKEFFIDDDAKNGEDGEQEAVVITKCEGFPLARRGRILATDYQKATAVAHILESLATGTNKDGSGGGKTSGVSLVFVDDCVVNAYDVHVRRFEEEGHRGLAALTVLWWDTFEEEKEGAMTSVSLESSDFSYRDIYAKMRREFGVSEEAEAARVAAYLEIASRWKKVEPEVKREVKKLAGLDEKFAVLSSINRKSGGV